jgi:HK97 gp10 family phage protein
MASAAKVEGLQSVMDALEELSDKEAAKALKVAGEAEMERVLGRARTLVPKNSGALAKSLGYKTRMQIKKGVITTFLGVRKGFAVPDGKTKGGSTRYADPRKYAHLVEFGTVKNRAKPFLGPAIERAHGSVSGGQYASDLDLAIQRTVKRLAAKAARNAKKQARK